jgi:ribosomal protein L12E/L44/L45/RPP1/RPP2
VSACRYPGSKSKSKLKLNPKPKDKDGEQEKKGGDQEEEDAEHMKEAWFISGAGVKITMKIGCVDKGGVTVAAAAEDEKKKEKEKKKGVAAVFIVGVLCSAMVVAMGGSSRLGSVEVKALSRGGDDE